MVGRTSSRYEVLEKLREGEAAAESLGTRAEAP